MKFRKLAIGLSVLTIINTGTPTIKVLANELGNSKTIENSNYSNEKSAKINKFTALDSKNLQEYNKIYKIDESNIQSITTNGKNSSGGPIQYAVDGDIETFWHTGKLNSDTFTNEVIVEFKENIDIDRIVYGNRRGVDRGFAESFSIYGASSSESEFEKIADGNHKNTQDFLEIGFDKTNVKKIKFVFNKGTGNWASIAEMWFYKEDEVVNKMNRLFTDNTLSVVSEEFNTKEKIEILENELKDHHLYDTYKEKLEDAKSLIENEKVVATDAKISSFEAYNNKDYNKMFKMDNSNIESIKNNAGNNTGKPIAYATDENINTAWESNTVNNDKFKNEVEIVFKEKVLLDRVVYGARQNDSKGFAKEFEIYGSKTTNGDTYELISTGKYNPVKGLIEAQFNPTEFKRMKFKFKESKDNWATISEIAFYKEDVVSDKMDRLFTDNTLSVVSEEFNTIEKIEALENEVISHPLYNIYKVKIEDAKSILKTSQIEATSAKITQFNLYDNKKYSEAFKMNNSNIESVKNNAGNNTGKPITYATDEDINTAWESNTVNNDKFKNEVEIVFKEKVLLDRVVYGARQSDSKGFAQEFEIYGSNTTSGDTYKLITTGKSEVTKGLIEAQFNPTEFKRMKFKFKKSKDNWATISEIAFYKQDLVSNKVNDLFKDGTMSELKDEFNSKEAIDSIANEIVDHPNKENLQKFIDRAYSILNNDFSKEQVKITLPQMGNVHKNATTNLAFSSFGTNFLTTGIVATPGEVIEVYVDADENDPLPQIVFSQAIGHWSGWKNVYSLRPGYNKFTVPNRHNESRPEKINPGGAVYLVNPYTSKEQSKAPVVIIEGGRKFPVYNEGDNTSEFIEELKEYKKYMDENPDTAVDIFEYNSKRIMFTGTTSDAYQVYVNEGLDIATSAKVWSSFTDEAIKFAGLSDTDENIVHNSTNLRTAVRVMQPHGSAYAAGDHVGIQKHVADDFLRYDKKNIQGILWGTMHEIGHQMDIPARTWGEVTNNMWSNDMYVRTGRGCRVNYNNLDKTVALNHNYDMEFSSVDLGMFWQLEAFQKGYWAQLERLYRERKPSPKDYQEKKDILAKYSSEIIGKNLTEYYERYGFSLSEDTKKELSKLPTLDKKIWYAHSNGREYTGSGFNENIDVKINSRLNEQDNTNTLTFEIDKENKDALLGYEILKDGVVIGFSRTNKFVIENINPSENAKYEVIPYDLKLNQGRKIVVDIFKPTIKSEEKITLEVNEDFDLKEYVVANNYKGNVIDNIDINHNIDISKSGMYNVEYKVVDNGIEATATTKVEVVSEYDYLSDFEWKSVKTQYGKPRKNNNIKARVNGEVKEYKKGFGIHANGEIVYDLSNKDYDTFEALLGVDMSIPSQGKSSITFKIVVDGKTVQTTKVLKHEDDAVYVSVPVKGAKELKIEINDGGNANTSDHSIIANAKLTNNNSKPSLEIEEDVTFNVGDNIDVLGNYKATDIEDGDITSKVVISGQDSVNINKPGIHKLTYTITDSDNNTITKERTITIIDKRDYKYLTDYDWTSATQSFGKTQKDKNVSGKKLSLTNENGEAVVYERGIGSHANATIIYDLSDKNYDYFTSYIGVDRQLYNRPSSIIFEVYVDNEKKYESKVMRSTDAQEFININITNAKELKLVLKDAKDGNGSDHGTWGDAKLSFVNEDRADLTNLNETINKASNINVDNYSKESVDNLNLAIEEANKLIKSDLVTQSQADEMITKLNLAIDNLQDLNQIITIEDKFLRESIIETLNLESDKITLGDMHNLKTLICDTGYVRSLKGLEHAINLETLNIDFNEVSDISPIKELKKLKNFSGEENFIMNTIENVVFENDKFIIEDTVIDVDGQKIVPKEVVLSPRKNPIKLDLNEVLVGNKIVIDSSLIEENQSIEVLYESKYNNYQLYTFYLLNN